MKLIEKPYAIALINQFIGVNFNNGDKIEDKLEVEKQYTKSDFIFYKFKNTNIAVTKNLNHLDFSILLKEDWDFLLEKVTEEYVMFTDLIDQYAERVTSIISKWNKEHSIISKIEQFINLSDFTDVNKNRIENKISENERLLNILLYKRINLYYENMLAEEGWRSFTELIEMDIKLDKELNEAGDRFTLQMMLLPNDNNIDKFKDTVTPYIGTASDRTNKFLIKMDFLLGMLVARYNTNTEDPIFNAHKKIMYRIAKTWEQNIQAPSDILDRASNSYLRNLENAIKGYGASTHFLHNVLKKSTQYGYNSEYAIMDLRRMVGSSAANLSIDYRSMTSEHLQMFKRYVDWVCNRHAKYVGTYEKSQEGFLLFYGNHILGGKKSTKKILEDHFNLQEMRLEIDRREREGWA